MRKHKQNHHTGDVARSNMNTADSSVPDIDAKLKNHKTGDMETADKCQLCKKKFADSTFKYQRPFKCKKCKLEPENDHIIDSNNNDIPVEDTSGITRNEETAYNAEKSDDSRSDFNTSSFSSSQTIFQLLCKVTGLSRLSICKQKTKLFLK